jgi:hypothetical protein
VKRTLPICALWLLALLVAACGSSASSASSQPQLSRAAVGRDKVIQMVLQGGDLTGFDLQSTGGETLKDQLPPPKLPQAALAARLVRANWIASAHSLLVSADHRTIVFSDANLFTSAAVAGRLWTLELAKLPGAVTRALAVPADAPAGARFTYERQGSHAGFQIAWRQGPVVGLAIIFVPAKTRISRVTEQRFAGVLGRAAHAQALRIAAVESGAQAS